GDAGVRFELPRHEALPDDDRARRLSARDGANRGVRARDAARYPADVSAAGAHHRRHGPGAGARLPRARRGGPRALNVRLSEQIRLRPAPAAQSRNHRKGRLIELFARVLLQRGADPRRYERPTWRKRRTSYEATA